jgi:hypothetical protein
MITGATASTQQKNRPAESKVSFEGIFAQPINPPMTLAATGLPAVPLEKV